MKQQLRIRLLRLAEAVMMKELARLSHLTQPPPPSEDHYRGFDLKQLNPEQSGLPKRGPKTAETSLTEGTPSGRVEMML